MTPVPRLTVLPLMSIRIYGPGEPHLVRVEVDAMK